MKTITLEQIKREVKSVTNTDVTKKCKKHSSKHALKMFCVLAKKHTYLSQQEISDFLNIPRANICYHIRTHLDMLKNKMYKVQFLEVENKIMNE